MSGLVKGLRIAFAATVLGGTLWGASITMKPAPAAEAVQCYEKYIGGRINEAGIYCPGNPAIWKSYTFSSSGIGYYTETYDKGGGRSEVRMGYRHRDGRIAVAIGDCDSRGCIQREWNGVPFP